jgi:hypothetical protein
MLLVTLNGMKLLPGETGDALEERSRRKGLKNYDRVPLPGTSSPTGMAEVEGKGEIV